MFKLAMIDDEDAVLFNLSRSFNWEGMGFTIAGMFNNAADFLDYLKENDVDVVLSDIHMPDMDGLELSLAVKQMKPDILLVLLSGYKYFDYARRAISAGVFSYLLKPLSYQTVLEEFERVRTELEKRNKSSEPTPAGAVLTPQMQKSIIDYLLNNQKPADDSNLYRLPIATVSVTIDEFNEWLHTTWTYGVERLYDAIDRMMNTDNIVFVPIKRMFGQLSYIAVSRRENLAEFENELHNFLEEVSRNCMDLLGLAAICKVDQTGTDLQALHDDDDDLSYVKSDARRIINLAETGNSNDAIKVLHMVITMHDIDSLSEFAIEMHKLIIEHISIEDIKRYGIYSEKLLPLCGKETDFTSNVSLIKELADSLPETVKNVCRYYAESQVSGENEMLKEAIRYIDMHYMDKISLSDVASSVYMSEYHFCRIFKRIIGINFVDYLNKVRIEKAQQLLVETNMKINEIFSVVGYSGLKYFYKKFKQITGMTPQEYRKNSSK